MVARYCLLGTAGHMTIVVTIETYSCMNLINPDDPRPLSDPGLNRAEGEYLWCVLFRNSQNWSIGCLLALYGLLCILARCIMWFSGQFFSA